MVNSNNLNGTQINPGAGGETRIALVLDRSGSMEPIRRRAREAFNEAVGRVASEARRSDGRVTLSLLTFNHEIEEVLVNEPADRARKLQPRDYQPDGMTALLDAVGRAIESLQRPGELGPNDGALVIVVSDGHENASKQVTQEALVERMQRLEATDQWTFTFMCANVDIRQLSHDFGLATHNAADWVASAEGAQMMCEQLAEGVSSYMRERRAGETSSRDFFQ